MTWIRATTTHGGTLKQSADPVAITDNSGGTGDQIISASGVTYNSVGYNNNRADAARIINLHRTNLRNAGLMQ